MLVVKPVDKPDGSKAYRRVGMGFVKEAGVETDFLKCPEVGLSKAEWSCWEKMLSKMKIEDIVLVWHSSLML